MVRCLLPIFALAVLAVPVVSGEGPSLAEALTRFHGLPKLGGGVNKGLDPERFKKLTLDDLKALKEIVLGGHAYQSDGKLGGHLKLADSDYRFLTALPALETLKFPENDLGDEALVHIAAIKTLKSLQLMENKITNDGLKHFGGHKELVNLDVRWNKQLDDTCIPHLTQLTTLQTLNIFQTKISPDGIKRLEKALPQCKIINSKQ